MDLVITDDRKKTYYADGKLNALDACCQGAWENGIQPLALYAFDSLNIALNQQQFLLTCATEV